jgi:hypothetical protein
MLERIACPSRSFGLLDEERRHLHDLLRIEVRWLTADEPLERGDQGRVDG